MSSNVVYQIPHEAWNELNQRHADLLRRNSELQAEREELRGEVAALREALRFIVRTYNNAAMSDARIASSMCQTARSALDAVPADPVTDAPS